MQIDKVYEPQRFEPHWAQWWIDSGIFRASTKGGARVFSLVIPPPNVTGVLHIGMPASPPRWWWSANWPKRV
jgi:valyl-tRNA synthetase